MYTDYIARESERKERQFRKVPKRKIRMGIKHGHSAQRYYTLGEVFVDKLGNILMSTTSTHFTRFLLTTWQVFKTLQLH